VSFDLIIEIQKRDRQNGVWDVFPSRNFAPGLLCILKPKTLKTSNLKTFSKILGFQPWLVVTPTVVN